MKHSGNGVGLVDAGGSENNAMKQNLARATLAKQVRNTKMKFVTIWNERIFFGYLSGSGGRENGPDAQGRGVGEETVKPKWRRGFF